MQEESYLEPMARTEVYEATINPKRKKKKKSKGKKDGRYVFITTMTIISAENMFRPKTDIHAYSDYFRAKEAHIDNIQHIMDLIGNEEDSQFFFNRYGKGDVPYVYYFDVLNQNRYILTLTKTKVKCTGTQSGTHADNGSYKTSQDIEQALDYIP